MDFCKDNENANYQINDSSNKFIKSDLMSSDGMPVGLCLNAKTNQDDVLLNFASKYLEMMGPK